jgi:hypothetical protein
MDELLYAYKVLQSILDNVPSEFLPHRVTTKHGLEFVLSTIDCAEYGLPYELIEEVSAKLVEQVSGIMVRDGGLVVTMPHVTEQWRQEDDTTGWKINLYTVEDV